MDPSQYDPNTTPVGIPPNGTTPNFVDPPSMSDAYRGTIFSFVPLMLCFLFFRLFVRVRILRDFGLDDVFCILGAATVAAYCGVLIPLLDKPLGRHLWDVPLSAITDGYLRSSSMMLVLFFIGSMFVKLTLLVLYLRLFQIHRLAKALIWGGVAAVIVFYMVSMILILDRCVPGSGETWLSTTFTGTCTPVQNGLSKASGVFGLVSDIYVLVLPIWLISKLNFDFKRKLGVIAVFFTGIVACGFSAAGLAMRFTWREADGTWSMLYIFGILELTIGNICACMPTMTPLLRKTAAKGSHLWSSLNKYYLTLRGRSSHYNISGQSTDKPKGGHHGNVDEESNLPAIPRGTLTGLRTFIRGTKGTHAGKSEAKTLGSDAATLLTQNSEHQDYHVQLKNIYTQDRNPSYDRGTTRSNTLAGSTRPDSRDTR